MKKAKRNQICALEWNLHFFHLIQLYSYCCYLLKRFRRFFLWVFSFVFVSVALSLCLSLFGFTFQYSVQVEPNRHSYVISRIRMCFSLCHFSTPHLAGRFSSLVAPCFKIERKLTFAYMQDLN